MKKENVFIDLSKLSKKKIKALPQIFENAGDKALHETLSDLISGKITDGFKFLFYSPSGWNQNDYPLNGRTEITYPEFIKLFEDGEDEKTCCDNPDIQWNKIEIYIGDKQGSYKDLNFEFCDNCGETFNEAFD